MKRFEISIKYVGKLPYCFAYFVMPGQYDDTRVHFTHLDTSMKQCMSYIAHVIDQTKIEVVEVLIKQSV